MAKFNYVEHESIFIQAGRWLYTKHRSVVYSLLFLLFIILIKNLIIAGVDSSTWFRKPSIAFSKLIELIAWIIVALTVVSKIPYLRIVFISVGMTAVLLIGTEATCLALYEWNMRPGKEPEQVSNEEGFLKKVSAFFAGKKPEEKNTVFESYTELVSASKLGVDTLPGNFEQLKIPGEPEMKKVEPGWSDWQMGDDEMGYKNKPFARVEMQSWSSGVANPHAYYSHDSLGRRVTGNELMSPRPKYAMFFGCSITYGILVDNKQTLPSIFERLDTNFKSYNYGVTGYGTHHLLALYESRNLRAEIYEPDGAAFYIYFPGHANRAMGDMDSYLSWNADCPFYYLKDEEVVRKGSFKTGRVLVSRFYEFIHKTYFCKYFDLHFPGKLRPHHFHLTAKMIEKSAKLYQQQFGNDNFYVVILPGWGEEIIPYLDELQIRHLDYDRVVSYWEELYQFVGDGHPRPLLYKILAEKIKTDVTDKIVQ